MRSTQSQIKHRVLIPNNVVIKLGTKLSSRVLSCAVSSFFGYNTFGFFPPFALPDFFLASTFLCLISSHVPVSLFFLAPILNLSSSLPFLIFLAPTFLGLIPSHAPFSLVLWFLFTFFLPLYAFFFSLFSFLSLFPLFSSLFLFLGSWTFFWLGARLPKYKEFAGLVTSVTMNLYIQIFNDTL